MQNIRLMFIVFKAKYFQFKKVNNGGGYYHVSLCDSEDTPQNYIVLEKFIESDEYEVENGMDEYYLEFNGLGNFAYKACKEVVLDKENIVFYIDNTRIRHISYINIDISELTLDNNFLEILRRILGSQLKIKRLTKM